VYHPISFPAQECTSPVHAVVPVQSGHQFCYLQHMHQLYHDKLDDARVIKATGGTSQKRNELNLHARRCVAEVKP
jgi:hypothetical protein